MTFGPQTPFQGSGSLEREPTVVIKQGLRQWHLGLPPDAAVVVFPPPPAADVVATGLAVVLAPPPPSTLIGGAAAKWTMRPTAIQATMATPNRTKALVVETKYPAGALPLLGGEERNGDGQGGGGGRTEGQKRV